MSTLLEKLTSVVASDNVSTPTVPASAAAAFKKKKREGEKKKKNKEEAGKEKAQTKKRQPGRPKKKKSESSANSDETEEGETQMILASDKEGEEVDELKSISSDQMDMLDWKELTDLVHIARGERFAAKNRGGVDFDVYKRADHYFNKFKEQLAALDAEGDDSDFEDPPKEKKKVVKEKEKKGIAAKQKSKVAVPGFASKSNAIDAPKPTEDPMSPPSPDLHNLALPFSCAVSVDVVPDENEKKNDRKAYANRQTMIEWAEKAVKEKEMTKRERKALNMDQAKRDHDYYKVMIELGLLENPPPGDVVPMKYIMQKGTKHTVQVKEGVQGEAKFVYMKQYSDVWVNWSHPPFYKYTDADGFEHESPYPGFYLPYDLVRTPKEEEEEDEEEEGGGEEE
uniref:Uncharacterized protein n=1 Tax=Chromera velia CCMP2878 TaxID=1169474 RepID=A0A0K6SAE1_9ALVE|eukprot:Cvel_10036.t1-p1 / transcript=Cvel_10036.t1 / gene=Cvel_10036 / organism=Chromera_velia_CCMP2878 / gene_product=hypothetical protein / transcript_product=hypothetical protein / location=Cvel_scaffold597:4616-6005(-) / protein_length=395 / sequence_SO=supercontig / SO=protein_coding / is_pseudo=false